MVACFGGRPVTLVGTFQLAWTVFVTMGFVIMVYVYHRGKVTAGDKLLALVAKDSQSTVDEVTNLLNARGLSEATLRVAIEAQGKRQPFALVFIDIKGFNRFISFGAKTSNALLWAVALEIKLTFSNTSFVLARNAADEFVAILPNTDEAAACRYAEDLIGRIGRHPLAFEGRTLPYRICVGGAVLTYAEDGWTYLGDQKVVKAGHVAHNVCAHMVRTLSFTASRHLQLAKEQPPSQMPIYIR